MKHVSLQIIAFLLLVCGANSQQSTSFELGTVNPAGGSVTSRELTASSSGVVNSRMLAFGYLATATKTLNNIRICIEYKAGTLASTDAEINVYGSTAAGVPDLVGGTLATATVDANSAGCKTSTGVSLALTSGEQYWLVVTNENVLPDINYFAVQVNPERGVGTNAGGVGVQNILAGAFSQQSNDSGDTWTDFQRNNSGNYRLDFSDSSHFGTVMTLMSMGSGPIDAAERVYDAREVGNKFTTPPGADLNLRCISFAVARIGAPTGFLRYRLYQGTTLIATTAASANQAPTDSGVIPLCFNTAQALTSSTSYRVVIAETTQSDTSGNAYGPTKFDWDTDANSLILKPFDGTLTKTVCTGSCNGGTWTDTTGSFYQMQLLLEFGDEFAGATPPVGGGNLNQNMATGGVQ